MTKTQLVTWLEKKRSEALREVRRQYDVALTAYTEKRNADIKLTETAKQLSELFEKAHGLINDWLTELETVDNIRVVDGYYGSIRNKITGLDDFTDVCRFLSNEFIDETGELASIKNNKDNIDTEIEVNYANVIANVRSMKNAKAAVEYLTELGFDLSSLIEADNHPVTTALSVQVDTKYLFIGGENNADK